MLKRVNKLFVLFLQGAQVEMLAKWPLYHENMNISKTEHFKISAKFQQLEILSKDVNISELITYNLSFI